MRAQARVQGRVLHLPDALIAATAKEHGLTLATRNISDFGNLGSMSSIPGPRSVTLLAS